MQDSNWPTILKKLPKHIAFSFGIALGFVMLISMGAMVLSSGNYSIEPSTARLVFGLTFAASLISLVLRELRR